MKVIALVENTSISKDYKSKHGLCLYIETKKHKLLFDLGSNSLFLENAVKLGVDITDIDRSEERRVGKECRSRWSPYH